MKNQAQLIDVSADYYELAMSSAHHLLFSDRNSKMVHLHERFAEELFHRKLSHAHAFFYWLTLPVLKHEDSSEAYFYA